MSYETHCRQSVVAAPTDCAITGNVIEQCLSTRKARGQLRGARVGHTFLIKIGGFFRRPPLGSGSWQPSPGSCRELPGAAGQAAGSCRQAAGRKSDVRLFCQMMLFTTYSCASGKSLTSDFAAGSLPQAPGKLPSVAGSCLPVRQGSLPRRFAAAAAQLLPRGVDLTPP